MSDCFRSKHPRVQHEIIIARFDIKPQVAFAGIILMTPTTIWGVQVEENGVAGIHIMASNNFTFEGPLSSESGPAGQAFVGSSDGPQPIEVIVESSSLVTFNDVYFLSANGKRKGRGEERGQRERGRYQRVKVSILRTLYAVYCFGFWA